MWKKKTIWSREKCLACKPLRTPLAEVVRRPEGGAMLTAPIQGRWPFRFPAGAKKTIQLDEMGLCVWDLCDGRTELHDMIARFSDQCRVDAGAAETAIVKFLGTLCQRRLIRVRPEGLP